MHRRGFFSYALKSCPSHVGPPLWVCTSRVSHPWLVASLCPGILQPPRAHAHHRVHPPLFAAIGLPLPLCARLPISPTTGRKQGYLKNIEDGKTGEQKTKMEQRGQERRGRENTYNVQHTHTFPRRPFSCLLPCPRPCSARLPAAAVTASCRGVPTATSTPPCRHHRLAITPTAAPGDRRVRLGGLASPQDTAPSS